MTRRTTNSLIARNTLFLYFRMMCTMAVTLYTSRVVLSVLGIEDFGIYNIVGSVVILFSFLNDSMTKATQRFLSYELGVYNKESFMRTFSMSFNTHIIIAIIVVLLSETIGLWFLYYKMEIPEGKLHAANIVFQMSMLSFVFHILRVPYNAAIIASEKMSFYAYMSIIEVFLKLGIVVILQYWFREKLITYSILVLIVSIICILIYKIYCSHNIEGAKYRAIWDKKLFRKLFNFSGWAMFGSFANIGSQQGGNMLINLYYGVACNAAFAVSNQVSGAIYNFISNFQQAFNPRIVKLEATCEKDKQFKLISLASKYSFFLFLLIGIPIYTNIDYILNIWLEVVPNYSAEFCKLLVLFYLIDSLQAPIWMLIYATGNIKTYQIISSVLCLLNIPISWYFLANGYSPVYVLVVKVGLNIVHSVVRMYYVNFKFNFPTMEYIKVIVLKCIITVSLIILSLWVISMYVNNNSVISIVLNLIISLLIILIIGLNTQEKQYLINIIKSKLIKSNV